MKRNEFLKISGIISVVVISSPFSIFSKSSKKDCLTEEALHNFLINGYHIKNETFELNKDFIIDDNYPEIHIDGCEFILKKKWFSKQPEIIFDQSAKGYFCNNFIHN